MYTFPARGTRLQAILHVATANAFLLYGWDAGVMGGILLTPQFQSQMGHTNANINAFMAAAIMLGDVIGCVCVSSLTWKFGRRRCILGACVVGVIGVALQTAAFSATQMIIGRFILGLGNGVVSGIPLSSSISQLFPTGFPAVVPVYVQEASVGPSKGRATGILITVGYGVTGIAIADWMDYGMFKSGVVNAWRASIAMQALFLVIAIILLLGVPESPRWLYAHNRIAAADDVLCRLMDKELQDPAVQERRQEIIASVKLELFQDHGAGKLTLRGLFKDSSETKIAKRIWLSWIVAFGPPLFGGILILFYASIIFASLGLDTDMIQILTAALNTATAFGMLFAYKLLHRFGRRPLLVWGGAGILSCMVTFTILTNLGSRVTNSTTWGSVAMLFVFQTIYGMSWAWLPYLYSVEIVPLNYRSQVNCIGTALFWLLSFINVYAGPIALQNADVGARIFIWFCLGGVLVLGAVILLAKETKGLSLEGIDLLWASNEYKAQNTEAQIIEGLSLGRKRSAIAEEKLSEQAQRSSDV